MEVVREPAKATKAWNYEQNEIMNRSYFYS